MRVLRIRAFVFSLYIKETIISTVWYAVLGTYGNYRYVQYFLFRIYTTREQDICVIPAKLHVLLFALLFVVDSSSVLYMCTARFFSVLKM